MVCLCGKHTFSLKYIHSSIWEAVMSCVFTCQLHPHQAAIVPDQLTNTVPEQQDGVAQELQNTVEHVGTL